MELVAPFPAVFLIIAQIKQGGNNQEAEMRRFGFLLVIFLLAGCISSPANPSNPQASYPAGTPVPSPFPPAYPAPDSGQMNPYSWLGEPSLFLQPGELTPGVEAGTADFRMPEWVQKVGEPQAVASSYLGQKGTPTGYGTVQLLYYGDLGQANLVYRQLVQIEESATAAIPQPDIAQLAVLFPPAAGQALTRLLFQQCHTVAWLKLFTTDQAQVRFYAQRLAQRIQIADCQGSGRVTLLPYPEPLPTSTPVQTVQVNPGGDVVVRRLPDPGGENRIRAYTFVDDQHGWLALGTRILITVDGGKSWNEQFQASGAVKAIVFTTPKTGWIELYGLYYSTNDGGASWQPTATKPAGEQQKVAEPPLVQKEIGLKSYPFCGDQTPQAGAFTALDAQTGWAFCTSSAGDHYTYRKLFQTVDGGKTWQVIHAAPPYGRFGAANLFFWDGQRGWLATFDGQVFATTDGGRNWMELDLGTKTENGARAVWFVNDKMGFVVVNSSQINAGANDALLRSDDGGKTWNPIFLAPPQARRPAGLLQFFANGSGVAVDYETLVTSDGGRSWKKAGELNGLCQGRGAFASAMSFINPQAGWMTLTCAGAAQPQLYTTLDGGVTWQALAFSPNPDDGLKGVSFVDAQNGYVVTEAGYLLSTADGGRTLSSVDKLAMHTSSLTFVTQKLGWELRGGEVYISGDAGKSWSGLPMVSPIRQFWLRADGSIWAVTGELQADAAAEARRNLLTSQLGSLTWKRFATFSLPVDWRQPGLDRIQFVDANHGWLRSGMALFSTEDGGKTWVQVY